MKILQNYNQISAVFGAKNKNIRKADDIQRASKQAFPMLSPSYVDEFYLSTKMKKNDAENPTARKYFKKLDRKLTALRTVAKNLQYPVASMTHPPYENILTGVKLMKVGNCEECADAVLATLFANGYYNSDKMYLYCETEYINKQTGKSEYKDADPLDHAFVITSLDKDNPKEKDKIIIDSWLGFADSTSAAKGKYKQVFGDTQLRELASKHRSLFRLNKYMETGTFINYDDYEMRQHFVFKPVDKLKQEEKEYLGFYSRVMYDNTILPKK